MSGFAGFALTVVAATVTWLSYHVLKLVIRVSKLETATWAQHQINANHTESIGILDVCTQAMGERVAKTAEQADATTHDVHRLVVVVGHQTYKVERGEPLP